jgi:hypothetical protein
MRIRSLVLPLLLAACNGTVGGSGPSNQANLTAEGETCEVRFHWLQKDAYANYGGRTTDLWPPHTTTQVEVVCAGQDTITAVRENHGSKPGDVDKNGNPMLDDVKDDSITTTPERAKAFLTAYQGCECAPATAFLTTTALNQTELENIAGQLATYAEQHLSCDDADVSTLAMQLQSGDVDELIPALASCSWDNGQTWAEGFDNATRAALGTELDAYHVCNNDGQLEAALFATLKSGADITACDDTSPTCSGPTWYYTP